ncbi:DNA helicase II [Pectobacterium carotovorum]|uniref:DNA helicase II n=1 Tax=Pectobacterium carotovorum subsp. carotovorum TaxID=555 RepID=A0AA40M9K6_PECCC|nr:DNA helicase II [Pectobacterium carotovorum]KFW98942.1 DNA-dependent helicase II [Pectobacterium carotovorum subsp. carotovorum]KML65932.1 DNA-dependent helicase II [Pectobacterium carotovorum subsp. carotovorum ICMP 5702]MBA0177707.1 DNA helicase II [Pectobacterium carotovorum]MBL0868802.1 DNA helicase II [Pectobacterium carotovorum]MBL0909763.1 DNA helicase II [Pectobacterium carotovorum]
MDVSDLLDGLNDKQRDAVAAPRSNLLVLAGAGSGKTRVLVHRIAWLLSVENCSPYSIMAVTFTNKAAAEMRHRIDHLIGTSQGGMWIGTFHGLAHRLLRAHHMDANLPQDFQILDSDDQLRLLKRLIRALNLDEKQWPPRQAMWFINGKKDEGLRPQHIESYGNPIEQTWQRVYQAYQEACDRAGLVDFAELLLRAHELWLNKPHVLNHYRERFTNILVDEFQDTNRIQYAWIRMLAGDSAKVMIVGDDDQSIYGWRGAQVENIQLFLKDFAGAETIRLEQNYRSTSNILKAANALIAHNGGRLGKNLWTDGAEGEPISLYCAFNELDEARYVVNRIKAWQENGGALSDNAILYRSNAQSRVLEEALLQQSMPYRIYGGMRFFERQEIKDALAYLRLIANRNDDAAFERVVNTPTRGIGDRTLDVVRQTARDRQLTLWQSTRALLQEKVLAGRAAASLQRFIELIDALAYETSELPLHIQTDRAIKDSGLWSMYEQEKGEKGQARVENLEELVTATRQFSYQEEDQDLMPLQAFLSHAALEAGEGQADANQDAVQLMTLHSAKGLEFPQVFIVGMEEGMFPSQMSLDEGGRLEEERRLAYVGVTRAMQKLTITYAESRRLYGKEAYHRPSRFVGELPEECVEEVRLRASVSRPVNHQRLGTPITQNDSGYKLGQRVRHAKFGEGTIVNLEGSGDHARLQVAFQGQGIKWLVAAYARLETV